MIKYQCSENCSPRECSKCHYHEDDAGFDYPVFFIFTKNTAIYESYGKTDHD